MAADLFVVPTVTFRLLVVLVILAHNRRRLVHVAVTEHPTAAWTAQQLGNAFSENDAPGYLLYDRDSVFADVATTIARMNIQQMRTAPRSPWHNAYVERVIGSIRRECLDHVIVVTATGATSSTHRVRHLLHAVTHAPGPTEGCTDLAPGHAGGGRTDNSDAARRRAPPPLRSRGRLNRRST